MDVRVKAVSRLVWLQGPTVIANCHDVLKKRNRQSTKFLLYVYTGESPRLNGQKSNLNHPKQRIAALLSIPILEPVYRPLECRGGQFPWGMSPLPKRFPINISLSLPRRQLQPLPGWPYTGGKEILDLSGIAGPWLWTDANSNRPKTSQGSTSESRGLWRSVRWSMEVQRMSIFPNPPWGYFPSSRMQNPHVSISTLSSKPAVNQCKFCLLP